MRVEKFLSEHRLFENPFEAEEARHDAVFDRLIDAGMSHPDLGKIIGKIDHPTTSIVFGDKGSGKTAIRLLIEQCINAHNAKFPDRRTLLVAYDDLNPVLDRVVARQGRRPSGKALSFAKLNLDVMRLEDHQDAVLSVAITSLLDRLFADRGSPAYDRASWKRGALEPAGPRLKSIPRSIRIDFSVLAALYDQPRTGSALRRWQRLCSRLRLRLFSAASLIKVLVLLLTVFTVGLGLTTIFGGIEGPNRLLLHAGLGICGAGALFLGGFWLVIRVRAWRLARHIHHETRAIDRSTADLMVMLHRMRWRDLEGQPWPVTGPAGRNRRFELTDRFMNLLEALGYRGMMVLLDRVDEPALISGDPDRMQHVIWPLLDNKLLQQPRVGWKLLLPIELRHSLLRESSRFFQEARLDKQHLIDRLTWSGSTLYDLCNARLEACRNPQPESEGNTTRKPASLMSLFAEDVSRDLIIDALDAMQQPRDAFKFLYALIQEHCRLVPDDEACYRISRLTIDGVRRQQTQRVQDFQRGLGPG